MDALHRVIIGEPLSPRQRTIAAWIVFLWIAMDVLQFCGLDGPAIVRLVMR